MNKILMYHSVGDIAPKEAGAGLYVVRTERFREQMMLVSEFVNARHSDPERSEGEESLKDKILRKACGLPQDDCNPCFVTFDDGLEDNYTNAYPILKEFGLKAYFFILAGRVGTAGYMSWKQIEELRDNSMIIGSHGMTHRIMTELNEAELNYELKESKKILEERLGQVVDCFSIPRGFYNQKIIDAVRKSGYKKVFTSGLRKKGQAPKNGASPNFSELGRIAVKADWDLEYFKRVMEKGLPFTYTVQELVKNASKKLLGTKNYDRLRGKVLKE